MTSHTTAIKYVPKNPTMPDDLKTRATFTLTRSSDRNDPSDSTRLTPKKNKIRPGSVRGALRTFSSPLLSPLRVSGIRVGRSGISRAKTSFRGVGGVLER
ncbi:hypothetical protein BDV28DRAFT_127163 [Aspergillus coremiiformis]|uniref:Uncharacterized protein n=1 Tax=Aspergillus coremiiformis TaxID=138285 RepID=A0A5N6ZJM3_9EURO|nr:hypothetical protein BDV28DRAFT_127163 [Aspergillus coremiiformis]